MGQAQRTFAPESPALQQREREREKTTMRTGVKAVIAAAAVGMVAFGGAAQAVTTEEEHFDALAVLKDEIHGFVQNRADEGSTHNLVNGLLEEIINADEAEAENIESFQSYEAFTGLLDVVGVPHGEIAEDVEAAEGDEGDKRKMGVLGRLAGGFGGGNVMIPPGTFIGGSPFIGLNDNPSLTPFTYTGTGARALAPELQAKFNAFYQQYCLQAAINADAGQYNFPGFDLGSIEIEVSNGGCVVDQ